MKYYKKAKEMMDMNATEFIGGVSESEVENAMKALSVIFSDHCKNCIYLTIFQLRSFMIPHQDTHIKIFQKYLQ